MWFVEECVKGQGDVYHFYPIAGPLPEKEARDKAKTCSPQNGGWVEVNSEEQVDSRMAPKKQNAVTRSKLKSRGLMPRTVGGRRHPSR